MNVCVPNHFKLANDRSFHFLSGDGESESGSGRARRREDSFSVEIVLKFKSARDLPKAVLTDSVLHPWGNRIVASAEHRAEALNISVRVRSRAKRIASWQIRVASWAWPFRNSISAGTSAWPIASPHSTSAISIWRLRSDNVTADVSNSHRHMSRLCENTPFFTPTCRIWNTESHDAHRR